MVVLGRVGPSSFFSTSLPPYFSPLPGTCPFIVRTFPLAFFSFSPPRVSSLSPPPNEPPVLFLVAWSRFPFWVLVQATQCFFSPCDRVQSVKVFTQVHKTLHSPLSSCFFSSFPNPQTVTFFFSHFLFFIYTSISLSRSRSPYHNI